ncbi:transcriptional regulator [Clostridium sp.]|jgi:tetratricopeptide (TPR) repeat protein|uniref:transcriptional regulator n=1 Tax=Clostridium sp. TaxID=1506 RepID=UPI002587F356|nr:transcriptional regulator [Clostridium sp.]MDF2504798.1 hypothetical protein [Clostridium sp.]
MEILSIGEKIKRCRVYKGYTLKDVCGDKISVSKMSCIENGKIQPDDFILELVSSKLEIDIEYVKKDIRDQLKDNLKNFNSKSNKDKGRFLKYNLEYAEEYEYYDLAFEFMHKLFNYYLDIKHTNSCQVNTARYYNFCRKSCNEKNKLIYYMDIGRYFYKENEYFQAASYYNNVRKALIDNKSKDYDMLSNAIYQEANCQFMMKNYDRAYEIVIELLEVIEFIDDGEYKARIYNLLGILCIKMENREFQNFEKKSFELCKDNLTLKAKFIYRYGCAMLDTDIRDKAYEYINKSISLYPEDIKRNFVDFILKVINTLIKMDKISQAKELSDKALNCSIDLHENVFIERSYYYKSLIMYREKNIQLSEMYMNLSLDILIKIGSKNQIYERYMEMGNLYFEMGNTTESLKYFSLAINLNKKI